MDKLARTLREDAAAIDVEVSAELDDRIRASLESTTPEQPLPATRPRQRPWPLWWVSSLTGVAAAIIVIVLINLYEPGSESNPQVPVTASVNGTEPADMPVVLPDLNMRSAVLTAPLEEELANLESDIRRAEEAVRKELGLEL